MNFLAPRAFASKRFIPVAPFFYLALFLTGCTPSGPAGHPEAIWGHQGVLKGELEKPRAIAIDNEDRLYLVDMLARIQQYDLDGKFVRGWVTPESRNGRPCGLTIARNGDLLVADTHYYRVLRYSPTGDLLEKATLGGVPGTMPGQFGFVTDVAEDSFGNLYVSEYGENDRIQKFSAEGKFILQWGGQGEGPGQFRRPQTLAISRDELIWVADACNHRIQVFDLDGRLVRVWGKEGSALGELYYPYGIVLLEGPSAETSHVYVCEYGNHRVQKFTWAGESVACWGVQGRGPGELNNPWALALDSAKRLHIVDSNNHRLQRVRF